jgi:hypothetical protein
MKGLIIIIGECFRTGGQGTRIRGNSESYKEQKEASLTHIKLLEEKKCDCVILTYTTQYDDELLSWYKEYLIDKEILNDPIGYDNLYHTAINKWKNIFYNYDYIFFSRIDLCYKDNFYNVFSPPYEKIMFPFICWVNGNWHHHLNSPRPSDLFLYIPKSKYQKLFFGTYKESPLCHTGWYTLINSYFNEDEIDVLINTFHDSNPQIDYNPFYTIANRPYTNEWYTKNLIFNKKTFHTLI